jgi:hypothetical protein
MAKKKSPPPPRPGEEKKEEKKTRTKLAFRKPKKEFTSPKLVIVAVEGWGKTTLAANIPGVALMMAGTETGYNTLFGVGSVPEVPTLTTHKWKQTLDAIDIVKENGYKVLALDELSGFEAQCHDYICRNDYKGNWTNFVSWAKGYKASLPEWRKFLAKLESLDIMIVALSHCTVETFKNPMGDDHDRYIAALYKDTWGATRRWADACLFGTFETIVDDDGKGIGGTDRVLFTEHRDSHDAKNRYHMNPELEMPEDPDEMWSFVWDEIKNPTNEEGE